MNINKLNNNYIDYSYTTIYMSCQSKLIHRHIMKHEQRRQDSYYVTRSVVTIYLSLAHTQSMMIL